MTRALVIALGALALASPAMAQAVPPRQFVGPPEELAGSAPTAGQTQVPAIPGGMVPLPKSRFVGPPSPEPPLIGEDAKGVMKTVKDVNKVVGGTAGAVGGTAKAYQDYMQKLDDGKDSYGAFVTKPGIDPQADPYGPAIKKSGDIAEKAKVVGNVAKGVSFATNVIDTVDKCAGESVNVSDCTKSSLTSASSAASVMQAITEAPGAGQVAGGLNLAANAVGLDKNCRGDTADTAKCAVSSIETTMAAASLVPVLKPMTTTYAIGMAVGNAAMSGAEMVLGQPVGGYLYDKTHSNEDAEIWAKAASKENLDAIRARRRAAYQASSGALAQKQATYEAEQRRIAEREAAARAAEARAASDAAASQAFYNNLMTAIQVQKPVTTSAPQRTRELAGSGQSSDEGEDYCSSVGRLC